MNSYDPRSWLDRLIGACLGLLVGAVAVYIAVRLVAAVWVWLAVILAVVTVLVVAVSLWRRYTRGW